MTALKVATVSAILFIATFAFGHQSVMGSERAPCESALLVYCATADVLGTGLAWIMWVAVGSIAIGWALVALATGTGSPRRPNHRARR